MKTLSEIKDYFENNIINRIGNNFSFLAEKKANTDLNNLTELGEKHFVNKTQIGGCILEAPNGVLQIINSGKTVKIPKGLKVLVSDGIKPDGTLNNFEFELQEDLEYTMPSGSSNYVFFLSISDNKQIGAIAFRNLYTQFSEQEDVPMLTVNEYTWYKIGANTWYDINSSCNSWKKVYRVKLAYFKTVNGVITEIKTFKPARILTYSDRLTNLNGINWYKPISIPHNTTFTAPMDGKIYIETLLNGSSNLYYDPRAIVAEVRGLIGNKVSVQKITSGSDVTLPLNYEYNVPNSYTINIPVAGYYKVWLIGGGGTGGNHINMYSVYAHYSGGSGAGFVGELYLSAGNHTVVVGGGGQASTIDGITAGAGGNGSFPNMVQGVAGSGGVLSVTGTVRNVELQSNGKTGSSAIGSVQAGGASVYGGYGAGGASNGSPTGGYFKLTGSYVQSSTTTETVTEGNRCYEHRQSISWDGGGNTVAASSTHSQLVDIEKGEQFILYTHATNGSGSVASSTYFYPTKLDTIRDI